MPHECSKCNKTVSDFEPHYCPSGLPPGSSITGEATIGEWAPHEPPSNFEPTAIPMPNLPMHVASPEKPYIWNPDSPDAVKDMPTLAPKHQCELCGVWMDAWVNSHACHPPTGGKVTTSISGVQKCPACGVVFPRASGHSVCQPAEQRKFFELPPEPVPCGWSLQWRWTAATQQVLALTIPADQLPQNDWVPHTSHQNVTTKAQARNAVVRFRRAFPCKQWRFRPTKFRDHEGGVYTVVI